MPLYGHFAGSACLRSLRDKDAAALENAATLKGYSPPRACVNESAVCRPPSILQLFQQFASSRLHGRGACSQALLENLLRCSSQARILVGKIGQTLQRKGFHDGTAIFEVALQGRG